MSRLTIRNSDGSVSQPMDLRWADALEKLAHYEDLEEQGRLVELPVPAGEEAWCAFELRSRDGETRKVIYPVYIMGFWTALPSALKDYRHFEFGELYASYAEAEAALAESGKKGE